MLTLGLIALQIPAFDPPDEKPLTLFRSWILPSVSDVVAEVSGLPFDLFVEDSYREYLLRFPERVTALGMADQFGITDDRLNDYTPSYSEDTRRFESAIIDLFHRFDRESLSARERVTYDVYEWFLEDRVEGQRFSPAFYPMDGPFPFSLTWPPNQLLTGTYPIDSRNDVLAYLDRLRSVPDQLLGIKGWLDRAAKVGIFLPPSVIISEMPWMLWVPFPEERSYSPLFSCLRAGIKNAEAISIPDRGQYLSEAWSVMVDQAIPEYVRFEDWLYELTGSAPDRVGMGKTPEGRDYYAFLIKHFTGLEISPEEVYELGLSEISRIKRELMDRLSLFGIEKGVSMADLRSLLGKGSGSLLGNKLRDRYIALKDEARERVADRLPVPERDVRVVAGWFERPFYWKALHDGSSPAELHLRFDIDIPTFLLPSLIYTETYPGRHLQVAIAQESDLPLIQQEEAFQGFSAGWAAYADDLAAEWGWYNDDPYGNIGRLLRKLEMAAIAVYDTGIHLMGWGYDRALSFYTDVTGRDPYQAALDVFRYGVWPGQGVVGLVGYEKLIELRRYAEEALGERFDLDRFNSLLLENGNVPLAVLEGIVEDYIDEGGSAP